MISFNHSICGDFEQSAEREWLETNGLGGFASSTISGVNTRRYHGLLVTAVRPPTHRMVLLSKLEETLVVNSIRHELATNLYRPGVIHPQGFKLQTGFRLDPFPTFTFRVGDIIIEKQVFMIYGENTTVVRYRLHNLPAELTALEVRPLIALRDYHSLRNANGSNTYFKVERESDQMHIFSEPNAAGIVLHLAHNAHQAFAEELMYRQFEYRVEQERGFDYHEDLFSPGVLEFTLPAGEAHCDIVASTERREAYQADEMEHAERTRRAEQQVTVLSATASSIQPPGTEYVQQLCTAADQFIVRRTSNLQSVIAGYHWFTDWGRDTMIALTGLTLTTRRFDVARKILLAFAEHLSEGMIPNRFPDAGEQPDYNTVDATLWFIHAAGELWRRAPDASFLEFVAQQLYPRLQEIIRWHERGTRYGIKLEADGLLRAGSADVQLTWMDAKVGDEVVTPRTGKPVEIQALWYNALCIAADMAQAFGDELDNQLYRDIAERAKSSFNNQFWNEKLNCLVDCILDDGTRDEAVRPNQIFAVSLPYSILGEGHARGVVEIVQQELLTPYGLRSLSPRDPHYCGRYTGDSWTRDHAYHQGTVWAWLLGPFITAYLKIHRRSPESVTQARKWTEGLREHLFTAGLGQISEIFDGDPPHTPRGCIAQAWSVAELLRCEIEELT